MAGRTHEVRICRLGLVGSLPLAIQEDTIYTNLEDEPKTLNGNCIKPYVEVRTDEPDSEATQIITRICHRLGMDVEITTIRFIPGET